MNSIQEIATERYHPLQRLQSITSPDEEKEWKEYLKYRLKIDASKPVHEQMLELTRYFKHQTLQGRRLFHLSVTYKPDSNSNTKFSKENRSYEVKKTDDYFINFYTKNFLPVLMKTRNYTTPSKRILQPICYSFLDKHQENSILINGIPTFPLKLHHHAIVAVHPETYQTLSGLEGENTIPIRSKFARKVMTTFVRECDPMTVLYASKMLDNYPEFLSFPDRLH